MGNSVYIYMALRRLRKRSSACSCSALLLVVLKEKRAHFIFSQSRACTTPFEGCPSGVIVKAMDCGIVVSEFEFQSHYYVHFRANTLGKGMDLLILPAMG